MKRLLFVLVMVHIIPCARAQIREISDLQIVPFGDGGQIKMLYDARQRPQAVYLNNKLHIVFNGGGIPGDKPKAKTKSMAVTYDPLTRQFSKVVTIGKASSDHHDGPVIWADRNEHLHVFYDWHHTLGTHLISQKPRNIGTSLDDWSTASPPAPKMSYQWMSRVYDNKQLVFYRTEGHYSSWTYRITGDNGKTWEGPENDVTDLDIRGGMDTDWSIYCAKAVSKDGNYLHVGFIAYDDYKRPRSAEEIANGKLDKTRQHNPLYNNRRVSYKYNLYYLKVNLRTHEVTNHEAEILQTPINLATANGKCKIWDTQWRGGGIVPSMLVEENDGVSFLHNISDFQHENSCDYYYVRFVNGAWKQTRITDSNHEWNSGYLAKSDDGTLHAYVITGEGYFDSDGYMDKHGGGNIEEWTSTDQGNTWQKARDLTPDKVKYPSWRYNNIQPVKRPDGTLVDGMLLFYGWKNKEAPEAKAFLLIDEKRF
ncbi:BNR-4 repeat-containing protein [Planctomycetota bacterium]